jgi:hypothetical protein
VCWRMSQRRPATSTHPVRRSRGRSRSLVLRQGDARVGAVWPRVADVSDIERVSARSGAGRPAGFAAGRPVGRGAGHGDDPGFCLFSSSNLNNSVVVIARKGMLGSGPAIRGSSPTGTWTGPSHHRAVGAVLGAWACCGQYRRDSPAPTARSRLALPHAARRASERISRGRPARAASSHLPPVPPRRRSAQDVRALSMLLCNSNSSRLPSSCRACSIRPSSGMTRQSPTPCSPAR